MNVPATDCEQIFGFSLFCHDSAKSMQASLALAVPESRLHTFIAAHHQHKELLKAGIYFCSVNKIGKVFRMKAQTCLSEASFCGLGKRERFLVEEIQPALAILLL